MQENIKDDIFLDGDMPEQEKESKNSSRKDISKDIAELVIEIGEDPKIANTRLEYIYNELKAIYTKGNRHSYSILSSSIRERVESESEYSIQILQQNMEMFYHIMQKNADKTDEKVKMSFEKLYDHVMLECDRNLYIYKIRDEISEKQIELSKQQNIISEKQDELSGKQDDLIETQDEVKEQVESAIKDIRKLYADLIGIVSIFVAIFALITVNANIAFKLTTTNMNEIFWGIIVMNVFVVLCIIALLGAVRKLIIDKLTEVR